MDDSMEGFIDKDRFIEEMYEQESWASSASYRDLMICPSLRSFSSLDLLSCRDKDEEECRLVNLNNVIKKLFDTIDDPVGREDASFVCCLLAKLLKYNGSRGFYAKHLPQIGEILEFLSMQAKKVEQYLDYLHELLQLSCKPLLLERTSEILDMQSKLQRYFSLLGYLLVLAPTKLSFDLTARAIEILVGAEAGGGGGEDTVRPDARHEAVEQSRLPLTLAELAEAASAETYPAVLRLALAVASVSRICCHRMLGAGIESRILIRLHPAYECADGECEQVTDRANLRLDKEDYVGAAECAAKILRRLTESLVEREDGLPQEGIEAPSERAMWSLRAAFRRELLLARGSSRSRKLRNELANLISAGLVRTTAQWRLVDTGLIDDLSDFFFATEFDVVDDGWAEGAGVETNNITGLEFKKTLLTLLARVVEFLPECVPTLENKRLVSGLLQLIEPSPAAGRTAWNSEQLWHLFKYAANALAHLAPKMPDEFAENSGSTRLLSVLERFATDDDYDGVLVTCFAEMLCCLSLANGDLISRQFIPVLFKMIRRILDFEALALKHQRVITYLLATAENIFSYEASCDECFCESNVEMTTDLLQRCLHQKLEDSELHQSFLIAIGSFACKCVMHCLGSLTNFLSSGGLYQCLDIVEGANLPVRNLFASLLVDVVENECCRRYLLSWRRATDKRQGILSLLANVWREEERMFGLERTACGCARNDETPALLDDDQLVYVNYLRNKCGEDVLATTVVGSVRPKIHHLLKLIVRHADGYRGCYFAKLFDELDTQDQITILAVEAYADLKSDEASLEVTRRLKLPPLTKSRGPLCAAASKLASCQARSLAVRSRQENLIRESRASQARDFRELHESILLAELNPAFDALAELSFVAAASVPSYRLKKLEEMRTTLREQRVGDARGLQFETCKLAANVTNVFDKQIIVQSVPNPSPDTTIVEVSSISSWTPRLSSDLSRCSPITVDSVALLNCQLDERGNVDLQFGWKD